MAGKPNRSGGARVGAGRKPKLENSNKKSNQKSNEVKKSIKSKAYENKQNVKKESNALKKSNEAKKLIKSNSYKRAAKPKSNAEKKSNAFTPFAPILEHDMLKLLQDIALGRIQASASQLRAAIAAVQYTHAKMGETGKKEAAQAAAKRMSGDWFAPLAAPRLVVSNGK